jgi:hypothetical protein
VLIYYDKPGGIVKGYLDLSAGLILATAEDGTARNSMTTTSSTTTTSSATAALKFSITASVRKQFVLEASGSDEFESWMESLMIEGGRQVRRREAADTYEGFGF